MSRLIESELSLAQMSHGQLPKERIDLPSLMAEVRLGLWRPRSSKPSATRNRRPSAASWRILASCGCSSGTWWRTPLKHRGDAALVVHVEETRTRRMPAHCIITSATTVAASLRRPLSGLHHLQSDARPAAVRHRDRLAICRRIAERHGGRIRADGQPGSGAIFTIELPR
jgi:hypothetical protein